MTALEVVGVVSGVLLLAGLVRVLITSSRWKDESPRDPEARQALYRLFSKRSRGEGP